MKMKAVDEGVTQNIVNTLLLLEMNCKINSLEGA